LFKGQTDLISSNTDRKRLLVHQVLHLHLHKYLTKQQKTGI